MLRFLYLAPLLQIEMDSSNWEEESIEAVSLQNSGWDTIGGRGKRHALNWRQLVAQVETICLDSHQRSQLPMRKQK